MELAEIQSVVAMSRQLEFLVVLNIIQTSLLVGLAASLLAHTIRRRSDD
jgi:hypothetical protein